MTIPQVPCGRRGARAALGLSLRPLEDVRGCEVGKSLVVSNSWLGETYSNFNITGEKELGAVTVSVGNDLTSQPSIIRVMKLELLQIRYP